VARSEIAENSRPWSRVTSVCSTQYGVMLVNPIKHPNVKKDLDQQFVDWLISAEGQRAVAEYKVNGQTIQTPRMQSDGMAGPPAAAQCGVRVS
jgi:ABC-type Fe3+ transport system substrate-binding protein